MITITEVTAAVLRGSGPLKLETLQLAPLDRLDVLVEVAGCGLCHTDLVMRELASDAFSPGVLGHEAAGTVVSVGDGVETVRPGDRVLVSHDSCTECRACQADRPYHCVEFGALNTNPHRRRTSGAMSTSEGEPVYSSFFGQSSFATHAVVREANLVPVPIDVPLEIIGTLGCGFLTGVGAVTCALDAQPGQSIVIFGAGAVGLSAVMAARISGAATIIAVDRHAGRLTLARELGATHTVNTSTTDSVAAVRNAAPFVEMSLDTTGVTAIMSSAVSVLAPGGRCGLVAVGDVIEFQPRDLVLGRTVIGIVEGNATAHSLVPRMIDWWRQGIFPFDQLIRTYPLADINRAISDALDGRVIKPVLIP